MKNASKSKTHTVKRNGWRIFGKVLLAIVWVFSSVIVSQLVVGMIMVLLLGPTKFAEPVWTAVYSAIVYLVALALVALVPHALYKLYHKSAEFGTSKKELGLIGLPTWTDIGLAPVGFVVYLLLAAGVTALFSLFPWFNAAEVQDTGFSVYVMGLDRIVAFITLVVVAPIAEEIIFRGWLYAKLRHFLKQGLSETWSMVLSILLVSVLFGAVHMQWNVGVNVFAMSIVLCGLREITGTIHAGILLHMLKNGVAFYLLYVVGMG